MESLDDLRAEYAEAVACEKLAVRLRREATERLLEALGVPAQFTTLRSSWERPASWLASVDLVASTRHFPPSWRRRIRELRAAKP